MVLIPNFEDISSKIAHNPNLNLPKLKDNIIKIEFLDGVIKLTRKEPYPPLPFANSEVFHASISDWRRLTAVDEGCKSVYEVTFDVNGSNFSFRAGNTIAIIPQNDNSEVDFIISHLDLSSQADRPYSLSKEQNSKGNIPIHIPTKSTLRYVLKHCVDLRSILKKLFLLALSKYTKDENERKVLEYLCSKEGSSAYTTHVMNKHLCLIDLFNTFKSCKPPIEVVLGYLPRLLPRPYSIVNSGLKDPTKIKICFSVIFLDKKRKGITTGWLEKLLLPQCELEDGFEKLSLNENKKSCKIPIYLRKDMSHFSLPKQMEMPMILIGPGTGVAPFLGFLEERELQKDSVKLGDTWLFFGCRDPNLDFLYKTELHGYLANGTLNVLKTAFSRVDNSAIKYIQDALLKDSSEIVKLIKDGASVFVCGDLRTMAVQVKQTFVECIIRHDAKTEEEALDIINGLQKQNKYVVDAWS